jgi:hypothetical protein
MKRLCVAALAALFSLSLVSPLSASPQFGRDRERGRSEDRVCLYRDIQYQGIEQCFNIGDSVTSLPSGLGGQASSIRIYGRATITVWDDPNFRGHTTAFNSSVPDLGRIRLESKSWSDRIQSIQVGSSGGNAFGRDRDREPAPPPKEISEGICVYERPGYQGRSQCWSGSEDLSDLGRMGGWSDRISSIRVFGRQSFVVYRDIGLRGASMVVNRDIPDLSQVSGNGFRSWDHQISSLELERRGRNRRDR